MAGIALLIEIMGLDRLRAKLNQDIVREPLAALLRKAAATGRRVAREGAPRDTGALVRSITAEAGPRMARVSSTLPYARAIEEGVRPGSAAPPPEALRSWLRRRGSTASPFVVARSIARRGRKGRFFMRAAARQIGREMPGWLDEMGRAIGRIWSA